MRMQISSVARMAVAGLLTIQLTIVGFMQIFGTEPIASNVRNLGYPVWTRVLVGVLQLVAVTLLWVPRYRAMANLGLAAILLSAVLSHLRVQDSTPKTLPAVVTLALLIGLFFLNRNVGSLPLGSR